MRTMRDVRIGVVAACACWMALGAASATAAETVGSNLVAAPTTGPAANVSSLQTTQITGATEPITNTSAGVITLILVKHGPSGADPGQYGFRVLVGNTPNFTTGGAPAELPDFAWPANDTPGVAAFIPRLNGAAKGIPVAPGSHLGIIRRGGTIAQGSQIWAFGTTPGGVLHSALGVHDTGSLGYTSNANSELLIQFRVEPDADGDGYGDETQDRCTTQRGTQGACVKPVKKKCKKKPKKKSASAAAKKKKCKKPKK